MTNNLDNPFIAEFEKKLTEFERKIEVENFNPSMDGFVDEFYQLKNDAQDLFHQCMYDDDEDLINEFIIRLKNISDENDLYDQEKETNSIFPNRQDKSDLDGELDSGFSSDKFLGLDD
jgi:hypothetical protein